MRVRGRGCYLTGVEGSSPPLPYIEVSDSEGEVLIRQGLAIEVTDVVEPTPEPKKPKAKEEAPPPPPFPPPPPPEKAPEKVPGSNEDRAETILHALDLVEGEPTPAAVAEITGFADVTAEEIAAAVATKAAE